MPKRKRYSSTQKDLQKKLKRNIILAILVPASFVLTLVLFGPTVGKVFGFISKYRNVTGAGDTVAPPPPIFDTPPNATKDTTINLNGFAEPGATIILFVNGPEKAKATTTSDGTFEFTDIKLIKGRNTIFAKSIDSENNESEKSQTITIVVDNEKPELEVLSPKDGETIRNLDGRVFVNGQVSEKATIMVNDRLAVVKPDLSFEIYVGVSEGDLTIKVMATDEAGNSTEEEVFIKYERKSD